MRRRTKVILASSVVSLLVLVVVLAVVDELNDPEPEALRVRTEPGSWHVPAGEERRVFVVLNNSGSEPLDVSVWVAPLREEARWLRVTPEFQTVRVPPASGVRVGFVITAAEDADSQGGEAEILVAWTERGHRFTQEEMLLVSTRPGVHEGALFPDGVPLLAAAAAGGALVGAGVAWLLRLDWPRVQGAVAAAMYTRIARSQSLDNANRQKVLAAIEEAPGVHFSELRRRTGLANGALYHHLRVLQANGHVRSQLQFGRRVYAPAGSDLEGSATASPAETRILDLLAHGARTQAELAAHLGITRQGVAFHLQNLVARGLLRREFGDGTWRYFRP